MVGMDDERRDGSANGITLCQGCMQLTDRNWEGDFLRLALICGGRVGIIGAGKRVGRISGRD